MDNREKLARHLAGNTPLWHELPESAREERYARADAIIALLGGAPATPPERSEGEPSPP